MKFQIRMCQRCYIYTMKSKCVKCSGETKSVHPARFSPDDKYLKYRILEKFD